LLDLSLPDGNGMALLIEWRRSGLSVPIIVMTAQSSLETRLAGLDGGADDFVLKPFAPVELIARIHAVVRRYARQSHEIWTFGRVVIEPRSRDVFMDGKKLELTPREYCILLELARDYGTVITKNSLAERLEPLGEPVDFSTIEVHISNLRRKIGNDFIKTVRGIGYMLSVDGSA
jgi:two-component system response regulator BasR